VSLSERIGGWLAAKMSGLPAELGEPARLSGWTEAHESPDGDVWAVTPPTGYGWQLWAPGSPNGTDFPYEHVTPAAVSMERTEDGCDNEGLLLAEVEPWLRSWVEDVTGRTVLASIDGIPRFGPARRFSEYVIYVRVGDVR
jgi:hypothetical protein